jgi:hypothetical protein
MARPVSVIVNLPSLESFEFAAANASNSTH